MKSKGVGLIVREISFQDFQPMWSRFTDVTDGQTDDMRSQYRALHYCASRGKNMTNETRTSFLYWSEVSSGGIAEL